jgi:phosphopantetheinyl transferase
MLGTYLGAAPGNLRFIYGSRGKPSLDMSEHTDDVEFSVSHSEELALCAIAPDVPIGVDVECVSWQADLDKIARDFFSRAQYRAYAKLPQEGNRGFLPLLDPQGGIHKGDRRRIGVSAEQIRCLNRWPCSAA